MEKLQPLIKHKFWIITGLALLLPFVGWWISTSAVAENIQQRWDKLQNTKVTQAAGQPNQDYVTRLESVNGVLSTRQSGLDLELYNKQKNLRTWPQYVANSVENKHYGDRIDTSTLRIYARNLQDEVIAMLDDLPRYNWDPTTNAETGMVAVNLNDIPPVQKKWSNGNPPTSQVMWETQEDVWLTRSILNAIKKVNNEAGATKITDAPIRILFQLHFRGGSRPQETEGTGEGVPGGEGGGGPMEGGGGPMGAPGGIPGGVVRPGFGRGMGEGGGELAGGGSGAAGSLSFDSAIQMNLDAVFGPDTIQATQGQGGGEGGGAPGSVVSPVIPGSPGLGAGEGSGNGQKVRRYVDDDPKLPYKTRGFYLEVYMLHDKLPDLQAALVSMPWPTELLMIHQVTDKEDDIIFLPDESSETGLPPGQLGPMGGGENPGGRFGVGNRQRTFGGQRGGGISGGRFGRGGGGNRGGRFGGGRFGGAGGAGDAGGRFPMGGGGNRFPMGGIGPMDPMGEGTGEGSQSQDSLYSKAMRDFYVTKIGIAGLMTVYRSPEEMAALNAQGEDGSAEPMDGQQNGNVPTGETTPATPEPPNTGTTEDPNSKEPAGTAEQDPTNPQAPGEENQPQTKPEPTETTKPKAETTTPPANTNPSTEEAKSPTEESATNNNAPAGSPP